jgi:rhamnose transport system permease protein
VRVETVRVVHARDRQCGRDLYAAGGNPEAAAYSGIDAGRMQFLAYTVCGAIAGVAGYLWVARFAVAYTDIALGVSRGGGSACSGWSVSTFRTTWARPAA